MRDADISRYSKRRPVFICRPSATSTLAPSAKTAPSNAYVEAEICADEKKKKKGKRDPLYQGCRPRLFYGLSLAHSLSLSATLFPSLLRPSLHDGITACTRRIDCAVVRTPSGPSERQEKEDKKGATAGSIRKKTRDKKHKEFAHVLERSAREQQEDNRPYCVERPCAADSHARACWHAGATCSAEPSVLGRGSRPLSLSISRVAVSFLSISFICKKKKKKRTGAERCGISRVTAQRSGRCGYLSSSMKDALIARLIYREAAKRPSHRLFLSRPLSAARSLRTRKKRASRGRPFLSSVDRTHSIATLQNVAATRENRPPIPFVEVRQTQLLLAAPDAASGCARCFLLS